jgi:hypothetical protein
MKKKPQRKKVAVSGFLATRHKSIERLEQRIADAQRFLKGRLEELIALRRSRDTDLAALRSEVDAAVKRCDLAMARRLELMRQADDFEMSAEELLEQAAITRRMADGVPVELTERGIATAKRALNETARRWKAKFRQEQDGRTRRKRTELYRLLERAKRRRGETQRLADNKLTATDIAYGEGLASKGTGETRLGRYKPRTKKPVEKTNAKEKAGSVDDRKRTGAEQDSGTVAGD